VGGKTLLDKIAADTAVGEPGTKLEELASREA
jgi:hypothetical protein